MEYGSLMLKVAHDRWERISFVFPQIGQPLDESDLKDIDEYTTQSLNDLEHAAAAEADDDEKGGGGGGGGNLSVLSTMTFTYNMSDDTSVELKVRSRVEERVRDRLPFFVLLFFFVFLS